MANVPFVYWSVHIWRTVHPLTTVVPTLPAPMAGPLWLGVSAFLLLMGIFSCFARVSNSCAGSWTMFIWHWSNR